MTEMRNTTTAEKKKMVAVDDHISFRLEALAPTRMIPWVTVREPIWLITGRAEGYRRSG